MSTEKTEIVTEQNKEMIEFFDKQLERTNYWLSFAEAKNGALLAINVAIMAVIVSLFDSAPIICTVSIICFIVSSVACLKSFFPNTNSRPEKREKSDLKQGEEDNLLFYGDIAKIASTFEYVELSSKRYFPGKAIIKDDKMIYDLASEILINSRITLQKYTDFKRAVKIDLLALLMTMLLFIIA